MKIKESGFGSADPDPHQKCHGSATLIKINKKIISLSENMSGCQEVAQRTCGEERGRSEEVVELRGAQQLLRPHVEGQALVGTAAVSSH